jgi:hypothetical protein
MNQFDDELREALGRETPPPGFADRTIALTRSLGCRRGEPHRRIWTWVLATAAALAMSLAPLAYIQHVRRREGVRAREQALLALRVTAESLRGVQRSLAAGRDRQIDIPVRDTARTPTDERRTP